MADAQLGDQRVYCANLDASPTTGVAEFSCADVVVPVRLNERQSCKGADDLISSLCAVEALEQFLKHQPSRDHDISSGECVLQCHNFRICGGCIAAQRERPNARINKERHLRVRSAL